MIALSVNINKVALLRNSREGSFPDVLQYAKDCIAHGAQGITAHPRPDQRHITAQDCRNVTGGIDVEFNIEGNPFADAMQSKRSDIGDYPGFIALIRELKPAQCTLVPDSNTQLTSDHGFDLTQSYDALKPIVEELRTLNIRSSLFMDPEPSQIELAAKLGADRIELYTGPYAEAMKHGDTKSVKPYVEAAKVAHACGLGINAGHDLNLSNLTHFASNVEHLAEVSIGHAFTVDCLYRGLRNTTEAYLNALKV